MKTVLITGSHGFIGRHLSRHLSRQGPATIIGLGHGAYSESELASWGMVASINGDVSFSNLNRIANEFGTPEEIYHLAGGSSVGPSLRIPEEDFKRTVASTCELLDWVRLNASGTPVVIASSAAVYGAGHSGPIAEHVTTTPFSPYGYHKRMGELLCESYSNNFGLRTSVVRLFSVYGPELRKQLIWDTCRRLAESDKPLEFNGTGFEKRDWLHISDCVAVLSRAATLDEPYTTLNGGTGIATTVAEIVTELGRLWDDRPKPTFTGISRTGDPADLIADVTYASQLGMKPLKEWKTGMAEYVQWFRKAVAGS
jgi:UDP-glucose 4-epimerase